MNRWTQLPAGGARNRHTVTIIIVAARVAGPGLAVILGLALPWLACRRERPPEAQGAGEAGPPPPFFLADVTGEAGIRFRHESGARGEFLNPETFGPGGGWFDHDGDGRLDVLLVNGNLLRGEPDPAAIPALYRNLGGDRFQDVTVQAGLALPFYGMGFAAADADNDGDQDLLLHGLHRSFFLRNEGGGRFRDATTASGLAALRGWVAAAVFLDYDRDGKLDLFAGNYVDWSPEREAGLDCNFGGPRKRYCPVAYFDPTAPQLFRGRGDGAFEETTAAAGLARLRGKALGVVVEDFDRDGDPDLFVANDSVPNFLLVNRGDGAFEDRGLESGFATDAEGAALAGMGIDAAWSPGGALWIGVGNFSGEPVTMHIQEGRDAFLERSFALGIATPTLQSVTFGLLFRDFDLDGDPDLVLANGHVFDVEDLTRVPYRQKAQVLLGDGWKAFQPLAASADPRDVLRQPLLGRALAAADYDGDGDLDLLLTENQGPAHLLRNEAAGPRRRVRVALVGTASARDALGAEVTLRSRRAAGPWSARQTRRGAGSYLAQSELVLTFGLEPAEEPLALEVAWPSGRREVFGGIEPNREARLVEGTGRGSEGEAAPERPPEGAPAASPLAARQGGLEHLRAGRAREAAALLEKAVALDPHDFVARRELLVALSRSGDGARLEAAARAAALAFPSANLLVSHFAIVLREKGERRLAERMFEEAARLDAGRPDVWLALADLAFDRGDHANALARYERAAALRPDSIAAWANIGKIHTLGKDYARARTFLEKALRLRPDYATALSTLGGVLIEEGDLAGAEEKLLAALASATRGDRDTLVTIHGNLGILYLRRRDRERAAAAFEKVLELEPSDRQAAAALERLRR